MIWGPNLGSLGQWKSKVREQEIKGGQKWPPKNKTSDKTIKWTGHTSYFAGSTIVMEKRIQKCRKKERQTQQSKGSYRAAGAFLLNCIMSVRRRYICKYEFKTDIFFWNPRNKIQTSATLSESKNNCTSVARYALLRGCVDAFLWKLPFVSAVAEI